MKFHKTIRFQLTVSYSLLFIISNLFFIIIANYIISAHYHDQLPQFMEFGPQPEIIMPNGLEFDNGTFDFEETMRQTRENDLQQIQRVLWLSFIFLTGLSFASGYIIAGRMLKPIKKINETTKEINSHNLDRQIVHQDTGDEISEMINNINSMISRLNEAFALQKQFVENASHELKTPLAIIRTNLDVAILDQDTKLANNNYISTALKSSILMNKLIEDLLLLSLADRDVKYEEIDVKELLKELTNQLKLIAQNKNVSLELKIADIKNSKISGNKALLQRAIMNIIENAINYSKEKGEIIIKLEQKDNKYAISIIDNGIGIPADKINKVFERFYRVDKSRSRKSGGSGLGLAITKKIIELHKGTIKINSVVNLGTEVIIIL